MKYENPNYLKKENTLFSTLEKTKKTIKIIGHFGGLL
jgi:hypothetical protein